MKNRSQFLITMLLLAATVLAACAPIGGGPATKTIYVGPYQADCVGVAPQKCLLVKENPNDDWTMFYDQIEGFEYEPGYVYELQITEEKIENPPADASDTRWTLVEIVEKRRSLEGTVWLLKSYANADGEMVNVLPGSNVTAVFADGRVSGNASCNAYGGTYNADGGLLTISVGAVTMMMCVPDELAEQEQAYLDALPRANRHLVLEDELRIADPTGQTVLTYEVQEATPLLGTTWELMGYNNGKGGFASAIAGTEITALFGEDGQLSGSAGCNTYHTAYEIGGNPAAASGSISIPGPVASTMMMCGEPEGIMEQEQAYLAALESARTYEIEGAQLTIYDAQGTRALSFTALESVSLLGPTWLVTRYNNGKGGYTSALLDTEITAMFGEDGSLTGSAGCNNYTSSYEVEGDAISIGPAATTRKMCPEPQGIMEQETAYLAALEAAATYEIQGDTLELRNAEGTRMVTYEAKAGARGADLNEEALKNMTYKSTWTESGEAALVDGEYREQAAPGSATETVVQVTDHVAYGDLNGQPAAAVVLVTDPGGSGTFYDLAVVVEQDGQPVNVATTSLGDRVQINSLSIENNQIFVDMVTQGPDDPMCCPTRQVVQAYTLQGDQLVPAEGAGGGAGLTGGPWKWVEFSDPAEGSQTIDNPEQYTVEFLTDGQVKIKADCNHASGTYTTEGSANTPSGSISIVLGPMTLAHCGPDSLSDQFIAALGAAAVYRAEGGQLILDLPMDSGTLLLSRDG
jgi:heat shock protein HslJ